jgi:anthranilate synthase/aminodeoxychorismate synthase-like glutamine amidotransferase
MLLLIDNYDSFTYNLVDYFRQLGEEVSVVKNDQVDGTSIWNHNFNKVVISPGPNTPDESGNLMQVIESIYNKFPILGICLGHQALGQFFGASLGLAEKPMHGKVSQIRHDKDDIYKNLPDPLTVCRYHSLILKDLEKTGLIITAQTDKGECMSFKHATMPLTGIQYHPEAILTEKGLQILRNWLDIIG